jgi:ATP-binding cassette, subfamily B, bacterial CvaB/MchF/RaxB
MWMQSSPRLLFWNRRRIPNILQSEAAECGLVCLAAIASYWGYRIDVANMRRRHSVSLKGATLKALMSIAHGMALQARPVKLGLAHLARLRLPCILHWDMNHFVVLKIVRRTGIVIHDPAAGERQLTMMEVSKHFTGVALELSPGAQFRKTEEVLRFSLLSLMGPVIGLKRGLIQILLLGIALQICVLAAPFYIQWIIDEVVVVGDRDLLTVLGIGFLLLVLVQAAITAMRYWVMVTLATDINFQWLGNTFNHLMRLPLPFFEKRHLGDIISRFGSIQTIQSSLTTQFVEGVVDGLLVVGTFALMMFYSVQLTLVATSAVIIYLLLRLAIFRAQREAATEQIIHSARQQTHFLESVRGVQSLRLFNRIEVRRVGWANALIEQFNAELLGAKLSISYQTVNAILFNAERVLVIWLAALAVIDSRFSVGMLFAFLSYKDQFSQRIASLIDKVFEVRMLRLHGERVADIVLTAPEDDQPGVEVKISTIIPNIEARNVCFRYSDSEPYILKDLNLYIPAGQCIALTGASGCGKTTLVKLILGLLEPSDGEILVGGISPRRFGLENYRNLVAAVMQEDQLFAGSIADNISFFDPEPDLGQIETCAKLAAVHDEIMAFLMAYNTLVGDIGTGLSGGQKQRILLARALYKNPKLLFLDEATSHLDVCNEQLVNDAIREIELTRIIVAHRPETIAMAQRVVTLERGAVVSDVEQSQVRRAVPISIHSLVQ